ncbi:hypothetical protein [Mycobacteroides chelonae]|uniref:hypothetical protein n=1 Tax=Mycobacteroides chelonae TaxID=1774 RepID=UPI0008A97EE0|nr:hypothetical protein [Mycobacteroides chelonae]OHU63021.1 hypothetical protein BKG85_16435 [Mycobacteroides chelonae]
MTFLDVVTYPYQVPYERLWGQVQYSTLSDKAAVWLLVWMTGTFTVGIGFLVIHGVIYFGADYLRERSRRLVAAASFGARIEQRRRYAHWGVRVDSWLRDVQLHTVYRRGLVPDQPRSDRLGKMTRSGTGASVLITVSGSVATFVAEIGRWLLTWFGLYSLGATAWVVAQPQIRSAAEQIGRNFGDKQLFGLGFTIVAFLMLNAVSWRRRGLSKWRAEHLAAGYEDLDKIQAILREVRRLVSPAITEWHTNMSRSWRQAHEDGRQGNRSPLTLPPQPIWPEEFDQTYQTCVAKLNEVNEISTKREGSNPLWIVTPRSAFLITHWPEDYLDVELFSPTTRDSIAACLHQAKALSSAYWQALSVQLRLASLNAYAGAFAVISDLVVEPGVRYLAAVRSIHPDHDEQAGTFAEASKTYESVRTAACVTLANQLRTVLAQQLLWSKLAGHSEADDDVEAEVIDDYRDVECGYTEDDEDFDDVANTDGQQRAVGPLDDADDLQDQFATATAAAIPNAIMAACNQLRHDLNPLEIRRRQRKDDYLQDLWDKLAPEPAIDPQIADRKAMETQVQHAFRSAIAAARLSLRMELAELTEDGPAHRLYRAGLEREISRGCRTEAELRQYLTNVDAHLLPRTTWGRIMAAFNR